jgi:hypothetical protein
MGEIKSALELALERTESVKSDKEGLEKAAYIDKGKRIASRLYSPEEKDYDISKALKEFSGKQAVWVKEGVFSVCLANITLPAEEEDINRLKRSLKGLEAVVKDRKMVNALGKQLEDFFKRYLSDKEQLVEAVREQFGPRIKEKEQELAQQLGTEVHLDPSSDPEFAKYLNQNMNRLKEQYLNALNQAKEELTKQKPR